MKAPTDLKTQMFQTPLLGTYGHRNFKKNTYKIIVNVFFLIIFFLISIDVSAVKGDEVVRY